MKLIRHILSHLFLITVLLALVAMYYYRSFLFPVAVVEKIDKLAGDIYPPAVNFVSKREYFWSVKGEKLTGLDDFSLFSGGKEQPQAKSDTGEESSDNKPSVVTGSTENTVNEEKQVVASASVTKAEVPEKDSDVAEKAEVVETRMVSESVSTGAASKSANTEPSNTDKKEQAVAKAESVATITAKSEEENEVVTADRKNSSELDLLVAARMAFAQGNMKKSIELYQQLLELNNDDADIYGELGNIYYTQGDWKKAGSAYYEAATRLIENKKYRQVDYLLRVIQGLDAELAEKLYQTLHKQPY